MSSAENSTKYKELPVFFVIPDGKELSLFISESCFAKEELKVSVTNLSSWKSDKIDGISYYLRIFLVQTSRF